MTSQQIASIIRQLAAVAATVIGVLSASGTGIHLPVAVQSILTAAGPLVIAIEHYVSDPSTGASTQTPAPTAPPASVALPSFPPTQAGS